MVTDEDIQEIKDMYRSAEYSKKEIAEKFRISIHYVNKYLGDTKPDMIGKIGREFEKVGYKLLSEEYIGANEPLKYLCPKHGERFVSWSNFQNGNRCAKCNDEKRKQSRYREINKAFKKEGYILLSEEYIGSHNPLRYICPNHGEQTIRWYNFQRDVRCMMCYLDSTKVSEEEIAKRFKEAGYTLLSKHTDKYVFLNYLCPNHGKQIIRWDDFQGGVRCPQCYHERQKGGYNTTLAERNKQEWLQTPATVYLVKLFNKNESFIKIGITTQLLNRRMTDIPYSYKEIATIHTNLYNATFIEEELLEDYSNHKYEPDNHFGGHTECLDIFALNSLTTQFKEINRSIQEEAA